MASESLLPLILCGGKGSRLWPLSRSSYPKQYIAISQNSKRSLLQQTQERLSDLDQVDDPVLICNEEHRFIVAEQMREIDITPRSILLEPFGRNTAPAITIGALKAIENGLDPILLILSADHQIRDNKKFLDLIQEAKGQAKLGKLVTFGIVPTSAETGYGYIEAKKNLKVNENEGFEISRFIEKPNKDLAQSLISDERYTWNSGIFMFKASVILNEIKKHAPQIFEYSQKSLTNSSTDLYFQRIKEEDFNKCPNISIDVAVMEKTDLGIVFPLKAGWSDIGNWKSVWENGKKDINGNINIGKVLTSEVKDSYFRSENRLLVGLGVKNLIAVETNDALLVADKAYAQDVKNIVIHLEKEKMPESSNHKKVYRPWGHYMAIGEGRRWQAKRIEVNPGGNLSQQMHYHRAEHWIIVSGTAEVEINGEKKLLSENQSTYIPLGSKHRLSNPGRMPLVLVEVQSGAYLDEDDIVRFKDEYGRVNKQT